MRIIQRIKRLITLGTKQIGRGVWKFSLPCDLPCVGATEWCTKECYGKDNCYRFAGAKALRMRNWNLVQNNLAQFKADMLADLRDISRVLFRIHDTGDFYDVEYTDAWTELVKANPAIHFWCYTRSWSEPKLLPALERLRAVPNIQLFASVDPTTKGKPPEGWRIAALEGMGIKGLSCLYKNQKAADCASCGYCFAGKRGNVLWNVD